MTKRLTFSAFIDKAFWALLLAISSYGVKFLGELSQNVAELNSKMEVMIYENHLHDYNLKDHERRITELEKENARILAMPGPSPGRLPPR